MAATTEASEDASINSRCLNKFTNNSDSFDAQSAVVFANFTDAPLELELVLH